MGGEDLLVILFLVLIIAFIFGSVKACHMMFEEEENSTSIIKDNKILRVTNKHAIKDKYILVTDSDLYEVCKEDYEAVQVGDIVELTQLRDWVDEIGDILDDMSDLYWKVDIIRRNDTGEIERIPVIGCDKGYERKRHH